MESRTAYDLETRSEWPTRAFRRVTDLALSHRDNEMKIDNWTPRLLGPFVDRCLALQRRSPICLNLAT
jgi:hypothetical protein